MNDRKGFQTRPTPLFIIAICLMVFAIIIFVFELTDREGWHYLMSAIVGGAGIISLFFYLLFNIMLKNCAIAIRIAIELIFILTLIIFFFF